MTAAIFDGPGPRWFSIPSERPFVGDLCQGLLGAVAEGGPEALAEVILLTPTRRGARAFAEGLSGPRGAAALLPQIRALGDLDLGEPPFEPGDLAHDLAPPLSKRQRKLELARLIHDRFYGAKIPGPRVESFLDAMGLADALGDFLDSAALEEVDLSGRMDGLDLGDHAEHFQKASALLRLAEADYPERLRVLGRLDPTRRQVLVLRRLAESLRAHPPAGPILAAGSTGSAPATADLLAAVAAAPKGAVVLPGLDHDLADAAWEQIDPQHPQNALKRLLARHGLDRTEVRIWPGATPGAEANPARRRLINEALRPAEATKDWLELIRALDPGLLARGLSGLQLLTCRDEEDAAGAIAVLMRETLETPGLTCALITPDGDLSRRVSARLKRFGVDADSSTGASLASLPFGALIDAFAQALHDPLDPVAWLSALKSAAVPFTADAGEALAALERQALRGPRALSLRALLDRIETPEARALAQRMTAALDLARAPYAAGPAPFREALLAFLHGLESLRGETGAPPPWSGADGAAAAELVNDLLERAESLGRVDAFAFGQILQTLMIETRVRTGGATHPRLRILGAIEARLAPADRLILAGLEEGVWPTPSAADPLLSRRMRETLGLPSPERRIGLSAHDFVQAASGRDVVLIELMRRAGKPAVPSRWLWRLKTLLSGADLQLPHDGPALTWARALEAPIRPRPADLARPARPQPRPPISARPRRLSVTQVETLVRDPYAFYASKVLGLRALFSADQSLDARGRGQAIHKAFELAAAQTLHAESDGAARLAQLYLDCLEAAGLSQEAKAREAAVAEDVAAFLINFLQEREAISALTVLTEQKGEIEVETALGRVTLSARADRLEVRPDRIDVIDFKTGQAPSASQVEAGFSPQLTLTAVIAQRGGFKDAGAKPPGDLLYVRPPAGGRAHSETPSAVKAQSPEDAAEAAFARFQRLMARYADLEAGYLSRAVMKFRNDPSDYDHLARVAEWMALDDEGEPDAEGGDDA